MRIRIIIHIFAILMATCSLIACCAVIRALMQIQTSMDVLVVVAAELQQKTNVRGLSFESTLPELDPDNPDWLIHNFCPAKLTDTHRCACKTYPMLKRVICRMVARDAADKDNAHPISL